MFNKYCSNAVIIIILCCTPYLLSQADTTVTNVQTPENKQNHAEQLLREADSIRKADSIKKLELTRQIEDLKQTDEVKKMELVLRLKELEINDSLRLIQRKKRIDSLKQITQGYPVIILNDTLFFIYSKLGPYSPADRALRINEKLMQLAEDDYFEIDSFKIAKGDYTTDIIYKNNIIMSLTETDALWSNLTIKESADRYLSIIIKAVNEYKEETSLITLVKRILLALIILVLLYFIVKYFNRLFNLVLLKTFSLREKYLKGIHIGDYQLLDSGRLTRIVMLILKVIRLFLIVIIIYSALLIIFSIFPWTRGITNTLLQYILEPVYTIFNQIIGYLPNLLTIIVIYLATRYLIKLLKFFAKEIESGALKIPKFYPDWSLPTYNIAKVLVYIFMFILIFPYLPGSDKPIFQGVSVFLGVLFSLGSTSVVANIVAGLVITYMRPFKIGDRVKIGDVTGDVIEKTLLVTRLKTIKQEDITIPNSTILSNYSVNYSKAIKDEGLIIHTTVTIGYDVPWKKVHEMLINAALKSNDVEKEPMPFVLQTSLDDFYVSYQLNAYTKKPQFSSIIQSEIHRNIQDEFFNNSVEILSPHYRAVRDGNNAAIPPDKLPPNYESPAFKINSSRQDIE